MDQLTEYGTVRALPADLKFEIRRYLLHSKNRNRVINEEELLRSLSRDLQSRIARHVYGPNIARSFLLDGIPENLIDEAYSAIRRESFSPNEYIFHVGDPTTSYYVVLFGTILLEDTGANSTRELTAGDVFGEGDVLFGRLREINAISLDYSEVASISSDAIMRILRRCPQRYKEIRAREARVLWSRAIAIARARASCVRVADVLVRTAKLDATETIGTETARAGNVGDVDHHVSDSVECGDRVNPQLRERRDVELFELQTKLAAAVKQLSAISEAVQHLCSSELSCSNLGNRLPP
eukprot:Plantae.Rhodophyta-Rhodochaete_pulchella.ctg20490.p1 GENE.Plantae.Rhodophyta-Rhodochaete_pulchella.ctg20490~~Plantae.Rhodophyta-Rhodochaete_pulchella.ctg20490.p1  ORF type:complete len:296 (-),score=42.90 Plantae.Rhodophyta-Rhodochaete_pulchella.ctg20490:170-1057(-)